jgi:hypothetical protein
LILTALTMFIRRAICIMLSKNKKAHARQANKNGENDRELIEHVGETLELFYFRAMSRVRPFILSGLSLYQSGRIVIVVTEKSEAAQPSTCGGLLETVMNDAGNEGDS